MIVTPAPGCCQSVASFSYELNLKIQIYHTVKQVGVIQLCGKVLLFFFFFFKKAPTALNVTESFHLKRKSSSLHLDWLKRFQGLLEYHCWTLKWSIMPKWTLKGKNKLGSEGEKKCEEGNEVLMISHTSCVNHCWGSVMTGKLLIKAELLVLIDVTAGKSRI